MTNFVTILRMSKDADRPVTLFFRVGDESKEIHGEVKVVHNGLVTIHESWMGSAMRTTVRIDDIVSIRHELSESDVTVSDEFPAPVSEDDLESSAPTRFREKVKAIAKGGAPVDFLLYMEGKEEEKYSPAYYAGYIDGRAAVRKQLKELLDDESVDYSITPHEFWQTNNSQTYAGFCGYCEGRLSAPIHKGEWYSCRKHMSHDPACPKCVAKQEEAK